ncbi:MAG: HoxN/HupN/NixA family nickel/cobalt transporter [Ktedonobacterales bacterium]
MFKNLARVLSDETPGLRTKVLVMYGLLLTVNVGLWIITLLASLRYPILLGLAVPAYSFGLRHAVDADHISAIDNVTRKLMQEKKKPVGVGLFFSLGHSTVVFLMAAGIAAGSAFLRTSLTNDGSQLRNVGGLIGTAVSALFLYAIAAINLLVLFDVFKTFRSVTRGASYNEQDLDEYLNQRGLLARIFRPLLKLTDRSWKMYPIGFLFGLGFDTASEVAILAIAGTLGGTGVPFLAIMLLPLLFAAGMSLADTTDGVMMLGAYGWAFVKPIRKLYYNLNITLISVVVALVVGTFETLNIIAGQLRLSGPFWDTIGNLNSNFTLVGATIIGIFILSWVVSTVIYRVKKYEDLEVTPSPSSAV